MRPGDVAVLGFFAIGIIIVLFTSPSPGSQSYGDSSSYNQSYSSSNWSSEQYKSSGSDLDSTVLIVVLAIAVPLALSFKPVRDALFGTVGGLFSHPKFLVWFVIGFIGTGVVLLNVNPDPSTYEVPPLLFCLGGGFLLGVARGF